MIIFEVIYEHRTTLKMKRFAIFILFLLKAVSSQLPDTDIEENSTGWYQIEGKVYPPELYDTNEKWQEETEISVNGGKSKP